MAALGGLRNRRLLAGNLDVSEIRRNFIGFTLHTPLMGVLHFTVNRIGGRQSSPDLGGGGVFAEMPEMGYGVPVPKSTVPHSVWKSAYRRARYLLQRIPA